MRLLGTNTDISGWARHTTGAVAVTIALGVSAQHPVGPPDPWATPDSPTIAAADALAFIAGTMYGDPSGNEDASGEFSMDSSTKTHLRRSATSVETLQQLLGAVQAIGGTGDIAPEGSQRDRIDFTLPPGSSIDIDLAGAVTIDGVDGFGLDDSTGTWTSTATGKQVRAFLAGFMQGEGNHDGKVGDDHSSSHLAYVQDLMATSQAYDVATNLQGRGYFSLWVDSTTEDPKVQAYPFIVYGRCPGGHP